MNKLLLFFLIGLVNCVATKKVSDKNFSYEGKIEITSGEETQKLRYLLKFDSVHNANIKIYSSSGFKVSEFVINESNIQIKYIIDVDYKSLVEKGFSDINNKICLKELLYDLISQRTDKFQNNQTCYSIRKDDISKALLVYNKSAEKVIEISDYTFSKKGMNKKYNLVLPNSFVYIDINIK